MSQSYALPPGALAAAQRRVAMQRARLSAHEIVEALPPITRAGIRDEFVIVNALLDLGTANGLADALSRMRNVPRPDESEMTEDEFNAARAQVIALFQPSA